MILLVEDNQDDELLTVRALRRNQVRDEIRVARTGLEALTAIDEKIPRLVLLDLKLPELDGHSVIEAIRRRPRGRQIPIVVLTSSSEACDIARAYELGANSYIQKPVDFVRFAEAARRIGEYWLELNRTVGPTANGEGGDGQAD